jgi:hypothetical protein
MRASCHHPHDLGRIKPFSPHSYDAVGNRLSLTTGGGLGNYQGLSRLPIMSPG